MGPLKWKIMPINVGIIVTITFLCNPSFLNRVGATSGWSCEEQHNRSEHPNPVLLKGESQLQIEPPSFPHSAHPPRQMGGQLSQRGETNSLACTARWWEPCESWRKYTMMHFLQLLFLELYGGANVQLVQSLTASRSFCGQETDHLLERTECIKQDVWRWLAAASAGEEESVCLLSLLGSLCASATGQKRRGQRSVW